MVVIAARRPAILIGQFEFPARARSIADCRTDVLTLAFQFLPSASTLSMESGVDDACGNYFNTFILILDHEHISIDTISVTLSCTVVEIFNKIDVSVMAALICIYMHVVTISTLLS